MVEQDKAYFDKLEAFMNSIDINGFQFHELEEGKPFDFREQYVGLKKVNLLIKNILSMEVPQGFAEED